MGLAPEASGPVLRYLHVLQRLPFGFADLKEYKGSTGEADQGVNEKSAGGAELLIDKWEGIGEEKRGDP